MQGSFSFCTVSFWGLFIFPTFSYRERTREVSQCVGDLMLQSVPFCCCFRKTLYYMYKNNAATLIKETMMIVSEYDRIP